MSVAPTSLPADLEEKYQRLRRLLAELGSALVTFSGGVDSTLVLRVAHDVLGPRCAALIAESASLPSRERDEARALAQQIGARLIAVQTDELERDAYARNEPDRCYHCKTALMEQAAAVAEREGFDHVLLGTNADDLGDHRPGHRAAQEHRARHPLLEAGLTKADVRALSHALGLPTWDKPEMACLASRIPYGYRVTRVRLGQVEQLEDFLKDHGFPQVRVRHHGSIARIEVPPEALPELVRPATREAVTEAGLAAGFQYVSVDLRGYRRGAMNEGRDLPTGAQERGPSPSVASPDRPDD